VSLAAERLNATTLTARVSGSAAERQDATMKRRSLPRDGTDRQPMHVVVEIDR
jgi:hypothetical protein